MKINDDKELVAEIRAALRKNKELYGKFYCPCVPYYKYTSQNGEDYVCPCKDFRESIKNGESCHCGLYIKEEK
jgi:ferredoxin-thioredoxin reductase catalytic subunit